MNFTEPSRNTVPADDRLLRASELVVKLGVSRAKVYRLMLDGTLPTIRIGGSIRVPSKDLEDWLNQHKKPALKHKAYVPTG